MRQRLADTVTAPERRAAFLASGAWDRTTLAARVAEHARERPDALAVADRRGERERSYADLEADARRVAAFLRASGVQPGDVVTVQLPNWYETVVIDLAILKVGAVLNPVLPIYRRHELRHILGLAEVGVLFTPGTYRGFDHEALGRQLRDDVASLTHHVTVRDDDPAGFDAWPAGAEDAPGAEDAGAVSELIFTSGTEALPKAIMHTEQTANFSVRAMRASVGIRDDDVVWMPSPIGHSTGFNFGVRLALYHGLPLVLQDQWNPADAARLVERYRCSYTMAATTFVTDLIEHAQASPCDLSSLRLLTCGGAPVPGEVVDAGAALGMNVLRLYGSTEALVVSCNRIASAAPKRRETDGPALDGIEIRVLGEHGPVIGEPGEIVVRGPNTSVGFYADPERTAATYRDEGWVTSGDIGILDAEGFLTIAGRKKEIIIRGGLNIAPREIEDLVIRHPAVAEAAVVGVADARLGEITCACVVLRPDAELELDELVAFLREQGLSTFKLPERLERLDQLPRTPSGKVKKHAILATLRTAESEAPA